MKTRILLAAALLAITASAFALSAEYNEFAQGPAQFLMTKEEVAQWKAIKTDDEAKAFVALFWARRDPTPGTAANENQMKFEALVAFADKNLGNGNKRVSGSMTDRGKTMILYGQPKKIERLSGPGADDAAPDTGSMATDNSQSVQWIYEGDSAKEMFNVNRAVVRFIDPNGRNEFVYDRGGIDLKAAQQRAIA